MGFEILLSIGLLGFSSLFGYFYKLLVWKPSVVRAELAKQGITGPPPCFYYGNILQMKQLQSMVVQDIKGEGDISHDYYSKIFSYFHRWRNEYGPIFTYSSGSMQHLYVTDPVLVKEFSLNTSLDLGKPTYLHKERGPLFGRGILTSNGTMWVHQRKVIAPQLYMEKVKGMVTLMVDSAISMVSSWETKIDNGGGLRLDIEVDGDLRNFSADVISRACFGSSYSKGKDIFRKLRRLQKLMSKNGLLVAVPGMRYLPTKSNRELWKLEKEVGSLILQVVKDRKKVKSENDLLQMILEGANNDEVKLASMDSFIIDNCKNIYFAGHETTATSTSWILLLLASHPEWQSQVRDEVVEICRSSIPDVNMLRKMKLLTMVIQEALRLYPPAPFVTREALQDTKLGDLYVPKGVALWFPTIALNQDPEIWGADSQIFNPDRFSNGIGKACNNPQVYMPFGCGPRVCVGQNFAMIEMKIIISLILSKFSFTLSPKYVHSPTFNLVIQPKYGVNLLVKKV